MNGDYRVRHPELKPLYESAQVLIRKFKEARLEHNLRHKNTMADKLANLAMDKKTEVSEVSEDSPLDEPTPAPAAKGDRLECIRCGMVVEVRTPSSLRPHQLRPLTCQCGQKMSSGPN
jgi:hypothetical protein